MATTVGSYGKINLGLLIGPPGMRADAFHELRTIYQTIALHDAVTVRLTKGQTGVEIKCADRRVPKDESNTCWRVAERVMRAASKMPGKGRGTRAKVTITIEKKLPVQGGLGAASSNAIATMRALERELKVKLEPHERLRIAEEVGSDLPLFLIGGTVLGIGRGEQVFPLPDLPEMHLAVATPSVGVSTKTAFAEWDLMFGHQPPAVSHQDEQDQGPSIARSLAGLGSRFTGDDKSIYGESQAEKPGPQLTVVQQTAKLNRFSHEVYAWLWSSPVVSGVSAGGRNRAEAQLLDLVRTGIENDFEQVVFPLYPAIRDVKRALERAGSKYASLSGSGSTVYGIFASAGAAKKAARELVAAGINAVATRTVGRKEFWK